MSSSKIQEYNLDPNCGFAKEDTAQEILSAVANGVEPSFRSPVSMKTGMLANSTVTGTGKGILHIHAGNSAQITLVVDGVTLLNSVLGNFGTTGYQESGVTFSSFLVEFNESFSLHNGNANNRQLYYQAVFY